MLFLAVFPVTEQSEDTGLVYPGGEAGRKVEVHHERLLLFWRTARDRRKTNIISGQKKKRIVETKKKVREKSL